MSINIGMILPSGIRRSVVSKREQVAIHFDMDGVIADTEPLHVAAELQTCRDFGLDIDESRWRGFQGMTARAIFDYLIMEFGDAKYHDADKMIDHKTGLFVARAWDEAEPIEGAVEFIEYSRANFDRVNLVTSSNRRVQECLIGKFGLRDMFDHVTTGDDVVNGKPHPAPYLRSAALSGIAAKDSIVVEDSKAGIESGRTAGCNVLAVTTSHAPDELIGAKPHWIATSYERATELTQKWLEGKS